MIKVHHEQGDFVYPKTQPGGGNPDFRRQMKFLKQFIQSLDFIRMKPDNSVIKGGLPNHAHARALVEPGKQYAIYLFGGTQANLELDIPAGTYRLEWLHPLTGQTEKLERLKKHPGGPVTLPSSAYAPDLALTLRREGR